MNTKENEFRGRSGKRDGDTKVLDKKMSQVSRMWDGDGKGFLNETEQRLRDLDEEGIGALSADQLKIFADGHQALQQENYRITKMLWGLVICCCPVRGDCRCFSACCQDKQGNSC